MITDIIIIQHTEGRSSLHLIKIQRGKKESHMCCWLAEEEEELDSCGYLLDSSKYPHPWTVESGRESPDNLM